MTVELAVGRATADGAWDEAAGTIGTLAPSIEVSAATQQQTLDAAVLSFPTEDLFVAFQGLNADGSLSLSVKVNPLISALWAGGVITVAGIVLACAPRRATPLLREDDRALEEGARAAQDAAARRARRARAKAQPRKGGARG